MAQITGTEDGEFISGDENGVPEDDVINALGGDDLVYGFGGDDVIDGGEGNDQLVGANGGGGDGVDTLLGGAGDDFLVLDGAGGTAEGGAGIDLASLSLAGTSAAIDFDVAAMESTLQGANGSYTLRTIERVELTAGSGDDVLRGGAFADQLFGGAGNDTLRGGGGNDFLVAGDFGGDGEVGSVQAIYGGSGNDQMVFGQSLGIVDGEDGVDLGSFDFRRENEDGSSFYGDISIDLRRSGNAVIGVQGLTVRNLESIDVYFSDGNDSLIGSGDLEAYGEGGDDVLDGSRSTESEFEGGEGNDRLIGGAGNDDLYGDEGDDNIIGGAGNDEIEGGAGNDIIRGGDGDDEIEVDDFFNEGEFDRVDAGAGDDEVSSGGGAGRFDGGAGNDSLDISVFSGSTGNGFDFDGGVGELRANGALLSKSFNFESFELFGSFENDRFTGDAGADRLVGNSGDDVLTGGGGDDELEGDDGADRLDGAAGADRISLGFFDDGVDTVVLGASGGDDVVSALGEQDVFDLGGRLFVEVAFESRDFTDGTRLFHEGGSAFVSSTAFFDTFIATEDEANTRVVGFNPTRIGTAADETLNGTVGRDIVDADAGSDKVNGAGGDDDLYGRSGNDRLDGGAGNDFLAGGEGADRLDGGLGVDHLFGGSGNDRLDGGAEADTLEGGGGRDALIGGAGGDTFVFSRNAGVDGILDWQDGDTLAFRAASFGLTAATAAPLEFGRGATGAAATFVYDETRRTLFWDPDGKGGAAAEKVIAFETAVTLSADDFVLI